MDLILQNITCEISFVEHRRTQFNLTVTDIINELDISRSSYYNKINGISEFKISELYKLSKIYGDDYKDYLDDKGNLVRGTVLLN